MDWISLHIFYNNSLEKLLSELIAPLTKELKEKKYISTMFFIRYNEGGQHLRYRVLPQQGVNVESFKKILLEKVSAYFENIQAQEKEFRLEFAPYIRETQRYGGEKNIEISEQHFKDSSETVLNLIKNNHHSWDYSMTISYALQIHLLFAKCVIKDINQSISFFEQIFQNWICYSVRLDDAGNASEQEIKKVMNFFERSYQHQKNTLDYLAEAIWTNNVYTNENQLDIWEKYCSRLGNSIEASLKDKTLEPPKWLVASKESKVDVSSQIVFAILDSYVHMTNNRLGIHLRDEAFIGYLIFKSLKEFKI